MVKLWAGMEGTMMTNNSMIKLRAAQHHLLAEFPKSESEKTLNQKIQSAELRKRMHHYRNTLHQKFVVFHIAETAQSVESEIKNSQELSQKLASSRENYNEIFVRFATELGDAASQGVEGNYASMLAKSVGAVVEFFRSDSTLRNELHNELRHKIEVGALNKLQEFVEDDASVDSYLSALRADHFYFQSEIERLYHSGQINLPDFQEAIAISSSWKEEIVSAIINLRDHLFQQYADFSKSSEQMKFAPFRDLAIRLITEFLIAPQQSGKISGPSELGHLKTKFLNGRRDTHISDAINNNVAVHMESALQQRALKVDKNSKPVKAIVATLKRHVIGDAHETISEGDETLLALLSDRLSLLLKPDLTEGEKLTLYADYYFNKVERQARNDTELEKRVLPAFGFFETKPDCDQLFFETLKFLGQGLLADQDQSQGLLNTQKQLLLLQEKIQIVLDYYFINFKKALLASKHVAICDERKIDLFVLNYLNHLLKQSAIGQFYHSYFSGLIRFKAMLPQPHQILLREDTGRVGHAKALFLGGVFNRLATVDVKREWSKLLGVTLFGRTGTVADEKPREQSAAALGL